MSRARKRQSQEWAAERVPRKKGPYRRRNCVAKGLGKGGIAFLNCRKKSCSRKGREAVHAACVKKASGMTMVFQEDCSSGGEAFSRKGGGQHRMEGGTLDE